MAKPKWLSVKNYASYQHYTNRNPGWIKLYWELLSDEEFVRLTMAERGFYCHCLLLASRHANKIVSDPEYIRLQLKIGDLAECQAMITRLIKSKFLIAWCRHSAITPLSKLAPPSTEREIRDQRSETDPDPLLRNADSFPSLRSSFKSGCANAKTTNQDPNPDSEQDLFQKKPARRVRTHAARTTRMLPKGAATWERYAEAYRTRYHVEPVRNTRVNSQLGQLVTRLGQEEAPQVAAWNLTHNRPLYVQARHPVSLLLRDAEGLHTEWRSGVKATTLEAREAERGDAAREQIKRVEAMIAREQTNGGQR